MSDHLIRKGAIYYYRRRVPADLLVAYGKAEYVRSLRTSVKRDAEVLCRQIDVEVDALFMMLRKRKAGAITGRNMVFHSFRHLFKDVCRDCGITKELADALQGHTEGDSSGSYGAALYPLNPMMDAMSKYKVHGVKLPG